MWVKYTDKKPEKSGFYLIAEKYKDRLTYSVGRYETDLEETGWHSDDGNEGFFDQDISDGSIYMINPVAWTRFDEYKE